MSKLLKAVDMRTDLAGKNRMELLIFHLGTKQAFGINVFKVKEVYVNPKITRMPESHPAVLGATNFRGTSISIIDIARAVGMKPLGDIENKTIITSEYNMSMQGLLVDRVDRIINTSWDEIHMPPFGTGSNSGSYITAITMVGGQLIEIIDVEKILDEISPHGEMISQELLQDKALAELQKKQMEVLIAEDSAVVRRKLIHVLSQMNLKITALNNGKEAYELLESLHQSGVDVTKKFLMVISDIEMPEMDGYTLVNKIRSEPHFKNLFIVLHSSMSGGFNERLISKVGADKFISKFQPDEFARMIKETILARKL